MKKFFTLFSFVFALSFNANAQLADGSIAPDFTATDINGVEYNLYSLLDEGKTVIIDVSATWCGPCWSYHNSGALETIWEQYGPDGTDEMFVFFIEGDASTTQADLEGTGSATTGNWIEGTHYPIIDNADIASAYQIAYYPTIYTVCPNRTVTESGQVSAAAHYANVDNCPAAAGANNGAILAYDGAQGDFCGELTFSPSITFQNLGTNEITSATIGLYLDGELVEPFEFEGSLNTFQTTEIEFTEINITQASAMTISIDAVNGEADDTDDYNSVEALLNPTTMVAETALINVEVITDNYGYETYWAIRDFDGIIYGEGGNTNVGVSGGGAQSAAPGNPGAYGNNETNTATVEVPVDGCYEFVIVDDWGDGICCAYGTGSYTVTDDNGNLLAQGGEFTTDIANPYEADFTSSVQEVEGLTALTVSPNPASNVAQVTFGLTEATDMDVVVYNTIGQAVQTINRTFNAGVNQFDIDASALANGIYFVNLNSKEGTSTVKFTVSK